MAEAGTNALASFQLRKTANWRSSTRWTPNRRPPAGWSPTATGFYASNAGSASLSAFQTSKGGQLLTLFGRTATDAGTVDAAVPSGGHFLYVQTGAAGNVDEFFIAPAGTLSLIGAVTVPGAAGGEGIVAP